MNLEQGVVLKVSVNGTLEVSKLSDEIRKANDETEKFGKDGKKHAQEFADGFKEVVKQVAELAGVYELLSKIREGIKFTEEVNDLKASIDAVSGSLGLGSKSLDEFEAASEHTRATAVDLTKTFRDDLPLAMQRGFSPEQFQKFTVVIANFATATGRSLEEVSAAFDQILTGRIRATNPILESLKDIPLQAAKGAGGLQLVAEAMEKTADRAEGMGQNISSTLAHVKDSIGLSFAEGFNKGTSATQNGMTQIMRLVNDPAVKQAISNFAQGVAQIVPLVARAITAAVGVVYAVIGGLEAGIFLVLGKISQGVASVLETISSLQSKVGLDKLSNFTASLAHGARDNQYLMESLSEQGDQKANLGADLIRKAFSTTTDAVKENTEALRINDLHLKDLPPDANKLAEALKKATDELIKQKRHAEDLQADFAKFAEVKTLDPIANKFREIDDAASKLATNISRAIEDIHRAESEDKAQGHSARAKEYEAQVTALQAILAKLPAIVQAKKDAVLQDEKQVKLLEDAKKQLDIFDSKYRSMLSSLPGAVGTPALEALSAKQLEAVRAFEQLKRDGLLSDDEIAKVIAAFRAGGAEIVKAAKKAADEFNRGLAIQEGLKNILLDVFQTGGKNFGQSAVQMLSNFAAPSFEEWSKSASNSFLKGLDNLFGFTGGKVDETTGAYISGPHTQATVAGAAALLNLYSAGQQGVSRGQNAVSGAVSGAVIGTQIEPGIGTVLGAIIGGIAGYLTGSSGKSHDPNATPYIKNGTAVIADPQNLTAGQIADLQASAQETFNTVWNEYIKTLMKLKGALLPQIPAIVGGLIGPGGSDFSSAFKAWLDKTLPDDIAQLLKSSMEKVFTANGVAEDAFNKFWEETKNLDPKQATQFWSDLADGINSFAEASDNLSAVKAALASGDLGSVKFLDGKNIGAPGSDNGFTANLQVAAKGLVDEARQLVNLTGPDRITAFAALGKSVDDITKSLQDYINKIADVLRNLKQSFADSEFQHDLSRITDPNQQARFLESAYGDIVNQLQHPGTYNLTPDDVQRLTQRGIDLLNQIYDLDPSQEADKWWHDQMATLKNVSESALQGMAQQATSAVTTLINELQPFRDYILGWPVDINTATDLVKNDLFGLGGALEELIHKIQGLNPTTPTPPGGGGPGGGGDVNPPPGGGKFPKTPKADVVGDTYNVVVNIAGHVVGVDDLEGEVTNAVIAAIRRNPRVIEPAY